MIIINCFWVLGILQFTKRFLLGQIPSKIVAEERKRLEFLLSWTREKKLEDMEQFAHSTRKGWGRMWQKLGAVFLLGCEIHPQLSLTLNPSSAIYKPLKPFPVHIQASVSPSVSWFLHSPHLPYWLSRLEWWENGTREWIWTCLGNCQGKKRSYCENCDVSVDPSIHPRETAFWFQLLR